MSPLIHNGAMADVVVAALIVEAVVLVVLRSRFRHLQVFDIAAMLGAGLFLALALRSALTGAGWQWIALFLGAAFAAHLLDVRRQLVRRR
jgi:hypothetical protein